jgi:deazaflavin-dependent oxidoreductase (nitroreductase family)
MGVYEPIAVWFAGSRPGAWFFVNVATRMDRLLLPLTRGRLSSCLGTSYHGSHLLLLTTTGTKSGQPRTVPLLYFRDGRNIVVIGSKGGHPKHPAWYQNIRAHPRVVVTVRGKRLECTALDADGPERLRLWARAVELYPGYDTYSRRAAGRDIPVVVLSPLT